MARPIQVKPADSESRGGSCHLSVAAWLGGGRGMGEEGKSLPLSPKGAVAEACGSGTGLPTPKHAVVACLLTHPLVGGEAGSRKQKGLCP